jgi:hypothetical protein
MCSVSVNLGVEVSLLRTVDNYLVTVFHVFVDMR